MVAIATTSTQTVTTTCLIAPSTVGSCKQVKKLTLLLQAEIAYSPGSVFQYFYSKQLNPGKYTSYSNILCRQYFLLGMCLPYYYCWSTTLLFLETK